MTSNKILYISYNNFSSLKEKKLASKFNKHFKNNFIWTPKFIKKNYKNLIWTTKDYTKNISQSSLQPNIFRSWSKNGLQAWKPQIIYYSLINLCKPNDILVYHDINFIKYPVYLNNYNFDKSFFSNSIFNYSIVLFRDSYQPLKYQCKKDLLQKYKLQKYKNFNGFWSGCLIVKNNTYGRNFIKKWCKLSTIDNLGASLDINKEIPDFLVNSVDQSTLSVLYYKENRNKKCIKITYAPFRQLFKFNFLYLRSIKTFFLIKYLEFKNKRLR